jgi:hypothetical protein
MSKRPTKIKATEALDTNEGRLRQSKRDEVQRNTWVYLLYLFHII